MRKDVSIEDRTRAIQLAVREAIRDHALHGHPISVWQDNQVVWIPPEEVLEKYGRTEAEYQQKLAQDTHD
jgi:hypothetical protein